MDVVGFPVTAQAFFFLVMKRVHWNDSLPLTFLFIFQWSKVRTQGQRPVDASIFCNGAKISRSAPTYISCTVTHVWISCKKKKTVIQPTLLWSRCCHVVASTRPYLVLNQALPRSSGLTQPCFCLRPLPPSWAEVNTAPSVVVTGEGPSHQPLSAHSYYSPSH